ncbi:MAG TPA: conjugative transposon protein TraM [Bacteroidia bacterium]|nr:conjugative transposon protein TraM [Bacteroidia bacterium]
MKKKEQSQAFLRKRKMMLVLPVIVLPFVTMAFCVLGGGKGTEAKVTVQTAGLNLNLPDAKLNDSDGDKLSFYEQADKDSLKLMEQMRNDPFYLSSQDTSTSSLNEVQQMTMASADKYNQKLITSPYSNSSVNPEQKLLEKIALLQSQLNQPERYADSETKNESFAVDDPEFNSQVNKLEEMMTGMGTGNAEDPEIKQLGNTLDKILDIQHPQRVKDRLKEKSLQQKETVFPIGKYPNQISISLLDTGKQKANGSSGFYGITDNKETVVDDNAIEVIVPENIILVNGAVLKLRLTTDIYINGVLIPRNNIISGIVALDNERLQVEINSIRHNNSLFPVKLEVYDLDGLAGIYIPGAISRDVAKQSADNSLQLMELTTFDPSLKAQAAAAGVNTVKSLLSRKVKQVKVMVKAGYKVLLRDKNIQQQ